MIPRFHCPAGLAPGAVVALPEAAAHHATRVLRLGDGAAVIVFDGGGGEWGGRLRVAGRELRVALADYREPQRESPLRVTLVQALPGGDKMDWVVQKAVELGVAAIRPVQAKRSVMRLSGARMERRVAHWRQVAVAACEQCGRNRLPEIAPVLDLTQYLAMPSAENEIRLLLAPAGEARLRDLPPPRGPVTLLAGPEGGFDDSEMLAASSPAAGFRPLSLGPRVLRTETAGLAAIAAVLALWGDF